METEGEGILRNISLNIRGMVLLSLLNCLLAGQLLISFSIFTHHKEGTEVIHLNCRAFEIQQSLLEALYGMGIEGASIESTSEELSVISEDGRCEHHWTSYTLYVKVPHSFNALNPDFFAPKITTALEEHMAELLWTEEGGDENTREVNMGIGIETSQGTIEVCEILISQEGVLPFASISGGQGKMAIIIDDIGYRRVGVDKFMELARPLNFAILPRAPWSKDEADLAMEQGFSILLHQPMEPLNGDIHLGEDAITAQMSQGEIEAVLRENLSLLPGVEGVNNHMGSKATEDEWVMETVLDLLQGQGLFFVDSRTSSRSVAFESARRLDVPSGRNMVFLDNEPDVEYIKGRIRILGRKALEMGAVIGIGHDRPDTLEALAQMIDELETAGIELVYLRNILMEQQR